MRAVASWAAPCAVIAYALLAHATLTYGPHFEAVSLVGAAIVLLGAAGVVPVLRARSSPSDPTANEDAFTVARWCALAAAAWFLVYTWRFPVVMYQSVEADTFVLRLLEGGAALVLATYAAELTMDTRVAARVATARFVALVAVAAALGFWTITASPQPAIDVWRLDQDGAALLLHGRNPYGADLAATDTFRLDHAIVGYPYPPLNLVLTTAAYALTGESRYAQLLALLVGTVLFRQLARRRSGDATWSDLVAFLLLFHPRGWFTLEQAWGEPLGIPLLAGFLWFYEPAASRGTRAPRWPASPSQRETAAAVMLGLLCALKQDFLLYLPFALALPGHRRRRAAVAVAVGLATVLPFLAVSPRGLWESAVAYHLQSPFRPDSLSLMAYLADIGVKAPPTYVGFLIAAAVAAASATFARRTSTLLLLAAVAFASFFYFGRQAFTNYYYFVGVTALAAAVVAVSSEPGEAAA